MMQVDMVALGIHLRAGDTGGSTSLGKPKPFRVSKMYTSARAENLIRLDAIYVGAGNQLLMPCDGWMFSTVRIAAECNAFEKLHGLEGKSLSEIQDYLDENELAYPDVPAIVLPALDSGSSIRVEGVFREAASIVFTGVTPRD